MKNDGTEFSKLDEIDQKVSVWLFKRFQIKPIRSWIDYIVHDYENRKQVKIDGTKLYEEVIEWDESDVCGRQIKLNRLKQHLFT